MAMAVKVSVPCAIMKPTIVVPAMPARISAAERTWIRQNIVLINDIDR